MKCPLLIDYTRVNGATKRTEHHYSNCIERYCKAWESEAKYNPETKQYEGDCRIFMLDRKVSGLISAHPA